MPDQTIEQEIQAKGLTAPRVTPADIEAAIETEHYFTAGQAVGLTSGYTPNISLDLLTFCVLVMRNGFTVVGKSACASPENFNAELGRKIAREDAISQCWPLLGYELRSKLAAVPLHEPAQTVKYTRKDILMIRTAYSPTHAGDLVRAVLRDGTHVEIDLYDGPHRALRTEAEIVDAMLAKANGVAS